VDPDPEPEGPKTCGSCGSGSPTLEKIVRDLKQFRCHFNEINILKHLCMAFLRGGEEEREGVEEPLLEQSLK
jgi:hypothetical protein